jgi:hypothetical protein
MRSSRGCGNFFRSGTESTVPRVPARRERGWAVSSITRSASAFSVGVRQCPSVSFFTVAVACRCLRPCESGKNKLDETTPTDTNGHERRGAFDQTLTFRRHDAPRSPRGCCVDQLRSPFHSAPESPLGSSFQFTEALRDVSALMWRRTKRSILSPRRRLHPRPERNPRSLADRAGANTMGREHHRQPSQRV